MNAPSRLILREVHSRPPELKPGDSGWWVKLAQQILIEWGYPITKTGLLDEDTLLALDRFKKVRQVREANCGPATWANLAISETEGILYVPLREAFSGACEIGGNNRGTYVKKYTGGLEGEKWAWCAAFATWCLKQYQLSSVGYKLRIPYTGIRYSSSAINAYALTNNLHRKGNARPGDLILIKGGPTGFRHTALASHYDPKGNGIWVIEGNVNANRIPWKWLPNMKRPLDAVRIGYYKLGTYVIVATGV